MFELVRSGIKGCLPVRLLPKQIVYAVELIVDAGVLCIPRFGQEYNGKRGTTETSLLLSSLTRRELDVLSLLGRGHTNQEIASDLYISESTVKSHLRSIFRKLGVKKRHEAQAIALQEGLSDSK
ncbi:MAG TPA: response regulator transcription factor [Syntrophaceticus sp.]|nr:response regulator transcription factor [Syntrophaceticus sp.]